VDIHCLFIYFLFFLVIFQFVFVVLCDRDVAASHILAMENSDIVGRHCFCNEAVNLASLLQVVHEAFHDMDLPTRKVRGFHAATVVLVDNCNYCSLLV
jgi:hypothetical protein